MLKAVVWTLGGALSLPSTATATATALSTATAAAMSTATAAETVAETVADGASSAPTLTATRTFVAPLQTGPGADEATVRLIEERLLISAKRLAGFDVVGARDVKAMLDLEQDKQQLGVCDDVSCLAEIAGALDAPQLVTGQLGRVGNTWILTLTRTDRGSMQALARVSRESQGESPEGLLPQLDGQIDELFGVAPEVPVLGIVGGTALGLGVLGVGVGVAGNVVANRLFNTAAEKLRSGAEDAEAVKARAQREGAIANVVAGAGYVAGGVLVAVGGGLLIWELTE